MLERIREIDDELNQLPEQLAPLAKQVERAKEILKQAEEANPARQTLLQLLKKTDRSHVENLGWCSGQQSIDPAVVAAQVAKLLFSAAGKVAPSPPSPPSASADAQGPSTGGNTYEAGLVLFVKGDGGLTASNLEGLVLRKLFTDPWLGLDSQLRARIMEELKRETKEHSKWLPEPRAQILDEEGKSIVGDGAGAFGGYFAAAATISMTLRQFRLQPPGAFSSLNATMSLLLEGAVFEKLKARLIDTATNMERARAVLLVAYVHLIRANQMGSYEREYRKIVDALGSAEVALETGQKRLVRLRTDRTEIVMQMAGVAGIVVTILAVLAYLLYTLLQAEPPPSK
jgi:hypothetical protein